MSSPNQIRTTRDEPIAAATIRTQPNPARVLPAATPGRRHRRPLPIEGYPQPARLRSVARTARARPAPRARAGPTAAPPAPAVYCAAARSSRLRPRIAPGSVRPAAPSAPRGGSMLRAPPSVARTARIHSLRVRCGLTSVNLREGRVGPSRRRALRYGSRAAAPSRSSAAGSVVTPARRRASRREARARVRRGRCRGRLRQPRFARSGSAGPGRGRALSGRRLSARRPPRRPRRARRRRRAPRASRARPRATRPDRRKGPSPSG